MSRKSAYKQVLSIGTAVVLGFALFTGSLDGAPKLLSPQSDEQAAALAEKHPGFNCIRNTLDILYIISVVKSTY